MTTKLNLVNDQIVALSVTTTESLVANTISGNGAGVSNVDAVSLNSQTPGTTSITLTLQTLQTLLYTRPKLTVLHRIMQLKVSLIQS